MTTDQADAAAAEIEHLKTRVRKLAEEKSHLQLIVSLIERLNPLSGLEDMVHSMLHHIVETIGGTNIKLYYWVSEELHYIDFFGENKTLEDIDDPLVNDVVRCHKFIELPAGHDDALLRGDFIPGAWTWAFPLLVGEDLIGVIKLENLHIRGASLRNYLPIFFSHAALLLGNEIRLHTRRKIEEALHEKTEELDSYFNNALDLFCIADTQGYFHKLNPEWQHALGYSLADLEGHRFLDFVHPDDLQATLDTLSALAGQKPILNFANRFRHKNGTYRWLDWRARPSGERIFAAAHDITERKNAEAKLLQLNAVLEQRVNDEVAKNREKDILLIQQSRLAAMGEMIHNIAHQWRQPINTLGLILANIKDAYTYDDLSAKFLDEEIAMGRQLIDKMSTTIDDFRNFFRPDREPESFEIGQSVEDALSVMDASLRNNFIEVDKRLPAGIVASGFPNQFAQVVLNILVNAKEAILQHKIQDGRIEIALSELHGTGVLTIQDNGGGIPQEVMPRIFDPYFTTKQQGSGIGLYMSRMIIERNFNGKIEVSNSGDGALFTVTLSLAGEGMPSEPV